MHLYQSNRLENLFAALLEVLADPLADPLASEVIVVQNPGMARWLSQQIALQTGIAANLSFPLPATCIWDIFQRTLGELPDLSDFDRDILLWRIMAELEEPESDPHMQEISAYLDDDPDKNKRFQLAARITDLFDQYQVYRPEMLLAWEKGDESHWQALLWRKLTASGSMHRAALLKRFQAAASATALNTGNLPERICFFGLNSLPPSHIGIIARLGRLLPVHLFHLSPCRQAWDDILPERLLAVKRKTWRRRKQSDISSYFTSGNPLLASMGTVSREFFSLLMQLDPQETDLYEQPGNGSLLTMIQSDILDLLDRSRTQRCPLDPADRSIRFHCCHSAMREIQVLHDRLLDLFADNPGLKPSDILVMAPDIGLYGPFVNAVFGSAPKEHSIPWSIADRQIRHEQPVVDGFEGLLEFAGSRFTASDGLILLENRSILRKFGLAADDLADLRHWIRKAGIRWGLDQRQRKEQGRDDSSLHTWEFGLERLLLGYMTGPLEVPFEGILPAGSRAGDSSPWLGGLAAFIRGLQRLRQQVNSPHSPDSWGRILLRMLAVFFDDASSDDQEGLALLREKITHFTGCCSRAGYAAPISLALIRRLFKGWLSQPVGGQAFLAGKVTFCNMVPMRSVPFQVIWLLGMNDLDYPRSQRPPAFDLMAKMPRLGDRSRRDDDRYLFLEALLSSRRHFSISWIGRDQQENSDLPPSVVVAELRDYIDRGWSTAEGSPAAEKLTTTYPLQPFSRRCYDADPETASYAGVWLPTGANRTGESFIPVPLAQPEPELTEVDIEQLIRFWSHPVRFFLAQRLGLRLRMDHELLPESEPFTLDPLQSYQHTSEIMTSLQSGSDPHLPLIRLTAGGELPRGGVGADLYHQMHATALDLNEKLAPLLLLPVEPVEIDLSCAGLRLTGWLKPLYRAGRISFRPATCKTKDILQLWILHLILLLLRPRGVEAVSIHAATDRLICFQGVDDPEAELEQLLNYYLQGQMEPLHFFPKTSLAWATAKKETAKMNGARKAWHSGFKYSGEQEDLACSIALRGRDPLDERFLELAAFLQTIVNRIQDYHAAA